MIQVFLHTRSPGKDDWRNEHRGFAQVPKVGEYLALSSESPWYEVQLVIHVPFEAQCAAEVYAVEVDHKAVKNEAFADARGR
jgi:hypothetical protein